VIGLIIKLKPNIMKNKYKWQDEILARIENMSNEELLDETLCLAGGDDYDGCFTSRGSWEYSALTSELEKRLKVCGFLGE